MILGFIWFLLVGVLIAGYALLDGFDLGVGTLYPFVAKTEAEKAVLRTSIGPIWDGNEVWLLTAAGALFAAFPKVYATVFSGFYLALMLVLFCLIFRAVSLEFRSQGGSARGWDWAFFLGSTIAGLLFGVALGNIVRGIPIDAQGEFAGSFFDLLNPLALVIGILGLCMFIVHGASWVALKTSGELRSRAVAVRSVAHWVFIILVAVATVTAALIVPEQVKAVIGNPIGWVMLLLMTAGIVGARLGVAKKRDGIVFLGSAAGIAGLVGIAAVGNYPASSDLTLTVMLVIALIGVPVVLAYTILVYRSFRGRISPGEGGGH
jgi:cytochrome d ubiquinol oxidase subunit II